MPVHDELRLTDTIRITTEPGLTELRVAVLAILVSVALAAASIGLVASGWIGGLVGGVGSAALLVAVLRTRRLRHRAMSFARWLVGT